jgi:predicted Zn-dependent peptidase
VVAAAGNVHHEKLLDLVMRHFPPDAGVGVAPNLQAPPAVHPSRNSHDRKGSQVHVCMSATTFPRSDPRRYASILVSTALGGGMSSRLFQRVREELGLVYTIYSFQSFYAQAGLAGLYMATRRDTSEQAVDVVLAELGNLAVSALPAAELQAVKNQTKGQVVLSLESTSARLQRLASTALYDEPYLTLDEICQRIDAVTEEEVSEICGQYYAPERHSIVSLGPKADSLD